MRTRVAARDYYDTNPPLNHRTGDIWSHLPTHGLLPYATLPGLVITPACDLAQRKVETITYLPILPLTHWFGTFGFESDVLVALHSESRVLKVACNLSKSRSAAPLHATELDRYEQTLGSAERLDKRQTTALERSLAGLRLLKAILAGSCSDAGTTAKELLPPKDWRILLHHLVTNHRSDLHFLPADELPVEWSILSHHSLVLFRYPLTAPVRIFDAAQDLSLGDWDAWIGEARLGIPLAGAFHTSRPLKGLTLASTFLADLLTRYAGLYLRIGSPDFTPATVDRLVSQLDA